MLNTKEHEDLVAMFEREPRYRGDRLDKEPKEMWARGNVYQDGRTNELFIAYRSGYAYGKTIWRTDAPTPTPSIP